MTTSPAEPVPPRRRSPWLWAVTGAVIVAGVVVALAMTAGGTASDDHRAAAPTTTSTAPDEPGYDLSTPEAAAESFAAAAKSGSGDELLGLACVGRPSCVSEHAEIDEAQLAGAQATIRDGVFELADHLKEAEFATPVDGTAPGSKDVPYRTPAMTGDAYLTLTFVESGGDWLFYLPA